MMKQGEHNEQITQEAINKAAQQLTLLYNQYLEEEDPGAAEKIVMRLGRTIVEQEHKHDFDADFMSRVIEHIQEANPDDEDMEAVFINARQRFSMLLGYLVANRRFDVMQELTQDKVLDALEEQGFFEMLALEEASEFDADEYEDEEEDGCCDDESCCADEDEEDADDCLCQDEDECPCGDEGCACTNCCCD